MKRLISLLFIIFSSSHFNSWMLYFLAEAQNSPDKEKQLIEKITKEGIEWFESMTVAEEIKVPVEVSKKRYQELLELTTEIVERNSIEE